MNLFKSGMQIIQDMKMIDVAVFKLYLLAGGLTFASYFNIFSAINPRIYLGIAILGVIYLANKFRIPSGSKDSFIQAKLKAFHGLSMIDAGIFKSVYFLLGLSLFYTIPSLQTMNVPYLFMFVFGMGRMLSIWARQA